MELERTVVKKRNREPRNVRRVRRVRTHSPPNYVIDTTKLICATPTWTKSTTTDSSWPRCIPVRDELHFVNRVDESRQSALCLIGNSVTKIGNKCTKPIFVNTGQRYGSGKTSFAKHFRKGWYSLLL